MAEISEIVMGYVMASNLVSQVKSSLVADLGNACAGREATNHILSHLALLRGDLFQMACWLVADGSDDNYLYNIRTHVIPKMEKYNG